MSTSQLAPTSMSPSSSEPPIRSFMQQIMQQHQIALLAIDHAKTHHLHVNSCNESSDQLRPYPPRWEDVGSPQTVSPTFPQRRLSLGEQQCLADEALEDEQSSVVAACYKIQQRGLVDPSDYQQTWTVAPRRYSTMRPVKSTSLPIRPKRRGFIEQR